MTRDKQVDLKLPLTFIQYAYVEGKMYKGNNNSTFIITSGTNRWGNNVVLGGIFLLGDFQYYVGILDALHSCSLSTLRLNHNNDMHHRQIVDATVISFNNLDDLGRSKYKEHEVVQVHAYLGNTNHPKISSKVFQEKHPYRIIDGVDKNSFKQLYLEGK